MAINIREELAKKCSRNQHIWWQEDFLGLLQRVHLYGFHILHTAKSGEIIVKTTHDLNSLLQHGAVLASKRVVLRKNSKNLNSIDNLLKANRNNMGGEVSKATITYIQKIISTMDSGYGKAFVNGKPTKLMFNYIANAIFEGSFDWENGDTSWSYISKAWEFPIGEYFTIESFSNSCDK